ncbi:hypothetical protein, partial [Thiocystis violacea]|uniref:hypothetical protein n=1 Tax=Thiocystis violacea TaxID=13725 RepID=UPI001A91A3C2
SEKAASVRRALARTASTAQDALPEAGGTASDDLPRIVTFTAMQLNHSGRVTLLGGPVYRVGKRKSMNSRGSLENKKAIAYRRNLYKREWTRFENALRQLGLHAHFQPLSAEESLDTEKRAREEITVSQPTSTTDSVKAHSIRDLEPSINQYLSAVGKHPLVVWLLNSNGLLFEATELNVNDLAALIQYDGDTVVVCQHDFGTWLVLDDNDDEIYGHFFEMAVRLGDGKSPSDE